MFATSACGAGWGRLAELRRAMRGRGMEDLFPYWLLVAIVLVVSMANMGLSATGVPYFVGSEWASNSVGSVVPGQMWSAGDFNGDGKSDLACYWDDDGQWSCDLYLSTGLGFTRCDGARRLGQAHADDRWFISDFSGDGSDDFARVFDDESHWLCDVYTSNGTSLAPGSWASQQGDLHPGQTWVSGDFNGDKRSDLATYWSDAGEWTCEVYLSTGWGLARRTWALRQGQVPEASQWFVGDFNGDGKDDIAASFDHGDGMWDCRVYVSTGSAFARQTWASQQSPMWPAQRWYVADFNGDGKTDFAKSFDDGSGKWNCDVHFSTGSSFTMVRWATRQGEMHAAQRWLTGDFNEDGKTDLAAAVANGVGGLDLDVHISTGLRFFLHRLAASPGVASGDSLLVGDFDGSGTTDVVAVGASWKTSSVVSFAVFPSLVREGDITLHLQAIRVADDDGGRAAAIDPDMFQEWVDFANLAFSSAGIVFDFDPAEDFVEVRSTFLNNIADPNDTFPDWQAQGSLGNMIATRFPGKVATVIRHGPGPTSMYGGAGGIGQGFVIVAGLGIWTTCEQPALASFAHELGHYLGLGHTHALDFADVAEAEIYFRAHGRAPAMFDGDGLSDTPPDPWAHSLNCASTTTEVTLDGIRFALPRENLMSYYADGSQLTPMQAAVARSMATLVSRSGGRYPTNAAEARDAGALRLEAESLTVSSTGGGNPSRQDMSGFMPLWSFAPRWSRDAQVHWGGTDGAALTLRFHVPTSGVYRMLLYMTLGDWFGVFRAFVDGEAVGGVTDTYAPLVLPSGPIEIATALNLTAGYHTLRLSNVGRNPQSKGYGLGVDCLELVR